MTVVATFSIRIPRWRVRAVILAATVLRNLGMLDNVRLDALVRFITAGMKVRRT